MRFLTFSHAAGERPSARLFPKLFSVTSYSGNPINKPCFELQTLSIVHAISSALQAGLEHTWNVPKQPPTSTRERPVPLPHRFRPPISAPPYPSPPRPPLRRAAPRRPWRAPRRSNGGAKVGALAAPRRPRDHSSALLGGLLAAPRLAPWRPQAPQGSLAPAPLGGTLAESRLAP